MPLDPAGRSASARTSAATALIRGVTARCPRRTTTALTAMYSPAAHENARPMVSVDAPAPVQLERDEQLDDGVRRAADRQRERAARQAAPRAGERGERRGRGRGAGGRRAGLGGRRREDERQDRRRDPDDGERRAEPGAGRDERSEGGPGGHADGGARHDGGLAARGPSAPSASFCAIHATAVVHTTPYARPNAKRPAEQPAEPGRGLGEHADGHERRGGERDPARAEAVGDDPGRERDRERRRARRGDQRGRRRGREVVDGGERGSSGTSAVCASWASRTRAYSSAARPRAGPRSVADGERERSHACATI